MLVHSFGRVTTSLDKISISFFSGALREVKISSFKIALIVHSLDLLVFSLLPTPTEKQSKTFQLILLVFHFTCSCCALLFGLWEICVLQDLNSAHSIGYLFYIISWKSIFIIRSWNIAKVFSRDACCTEPFVISSVTILGSFWELNVRAQWL